MRLKLVAVVLTLWIEVLANGASYKATHGGACSIPGGAAGGHHRSRSRVTNATRTG
ncbi:MAG: hypothetical protein OXL38_01290 [Gammaproteobacteria bacterium]|nr:hypothetical protein [Gammaproteobacteria bacterium]